MSTVAKAWGVLLLTGVFLVSLCYALSVEIALARNITNYRDTLSNSGPGQSSNHTLSFTLGTSISPGSYIEITPPLNFEVLGTSTFAAERNVELRVNSTLRAATTTQDATTDMVEIIPGTPGLIRYTLNTSSGIAAGANLEFKIGNHTSQALSFEESYSSTTGTTTIIGDIKPIVNASSTGTHKVMVRVYDGGQVADADFSIALVEGVGVGPIDTTEVIPPYRFNGAPSSTVSGTTLNVEVFVETDEFAICKYGTVAGVDFSAMGTQFTNTGLIYHTSVLPVATSTTYTLYVRCIDDEGNFNTDDYIIEFMVTDPPTGTPTDDGGDEGDGKGDGDDGPGDGDGDDGDTGESDGDNPDTGDDTGDGGSGGGGGGGKGPKTGTTAGGGFEDDEAYQSGDGRVTITGYAFPRSDVVSLVDGREAVTVRAGNDGLYSIVLDEIARGAYTFGVYAVDANQTRSSTFSTSFTVTGARTSALSNINLSPSVKASPDPVNPGSALTISGYAQPNAVVTIENEKDGSPASRQTLTATADGNGAWSVTPSTGNFSVGTYKARAKAAVAGGSATNFSNFVFYGVGQAAVRPTNADLNGDAKVNLVDFSILLFWWSTDGGTSSPSADVNGDAKVNLVDFSILLFNWTG